MRSKSDGAQQSPWKCFRIDSGGSNEVRTFSCRSYVVSIDRNMQVPPAVRGTKSQKGIPSLRAVSRKNVLVGAFGVCDILAGAR